MGLPGRAARQHASWATRTHSPKLAAVSVFWPGAHPSADALCTPHRAGEVHSSDVLWLRHLPFDPKDRGADGRARVGAFSHSEHFHFRAACTCAPIFSST